jgi:signal transduction histidine kinase/ActR/RegA family two-component response regulator
MGLLAVRAGEGAVAVLGSDTAGGRLARRFLIAAIGVPLLMLAWMRLFSERAAGHGVGIVLMVLVTVVIFVAIAWHGAVRLHQAEQKRLDVEDELKRANKLKDDFLATVSHELRTPLNAILGWATMLRRGTLDQARVTHVLEIIERNARAQAQLIEDLLEISRIVAGKLRLDVDVTPVLPIIQAAADTVRPAVDAKGIHLRVSNDTAGLHVRGDAARLQQVVWNLLSNAVKFTPRGGTVNVNVTRAGREVCIEVADTGEGISPEFLPLVFDRFQQADSKSTRRHAGLGLGLAITRHLVEMHGGTVSAQSAGPGRGSAFTIRLPLAEAPAANVAAQPAAAADTTLLRGLRILAVDDEGDARDMLKGVLEQYGAEVVIAGNATDALETLMKWRPDVAICDIGMPGVDGYGLIRRVRSLEPESGGRTLAIALTGYVRVDERVRALEAGYQMFVPKPIIPEELVAMIASLATSQLLAETEGIV